MGTTVTQFHMDDREISLVSTDAPRTVLWFGPVEIQLEPEELLRLACALTDHAEHILRKRGERGPAQTRNACGCGKSIVEMM